MSDPHGWNPDSVDVIVVGSGAAALTGAYTAAMQGLNVVVLEKTPFVGGISAYSGAGVWLPGNDALRRDGISDSVEDGLEFLRATVGDRTPVELQEAYVRTGPEMLEFLERDSQIEFAPHPFPDYYDAPGRCRPSGRSIRPVPIPGDRLGPLLDLLRKPTSADTFGVDVDRETLSGGQALIGRLMLALGNTGRAEIRTNTPMHSLVSIDGRVTGVRVGSGDRTIHARLGVLLAAGGYECNPERRREFHGLPGGSWTASPADSNTGDALAAAQEVGAATDLLDEAWWCPSILFPNGRASFAPIIRGGLIVGPDGGRFANESLPYDQFGHEIRDQLAKHGPDAEFWWVFDGRSEGIPGYCSPMPDQTAFRKAGLWRSGDSPEELAAALDLQPSVLRETIERFNGFARTGVDADFHRGEDDYDRFFGVGEGPNPTLIPVEGELHAVRIVLGDLGSKGGARIDTHAGVLDRAGMPIRGLFAAGGSAASVAGHVYPGPGVPLGLGMVFAYRAALAMAETASTVG